MRPARSRQDAPARRSARPTPLFGRLARGPALAAALLPLLAACLFWLVSAHGVRGLMRQQADDLGRTLARQTAVQMVEPLLMDDRVSMNVLLSGAARDSSVAEVAVLDVDGNVIALATGDGPPTAGDPSAEHLAPITLDNSVVGGVRVRQNLDYIDAGLNANLALVAGAAVLLAAAAAALASAWYQHRIGFPARRLAWAIRNIRRGEADPCPEPDGRGDVGHAVRQFNRTADFLARRTFLAPAGAEASRAPAERTALAGEAAVLAVGMSNYEDLAGSLPEAVWMARLNRFYFLCAQAVRRYKGAPARGGGGEVIAGFAAVPHPGEQVFCALCAAQLFLRLEDAVNEGCGPGGRARFRLAVHSGRWLHALYSPAARTDSGLAGRTLDELRLMRDACPDGAVLISEPARRLAGDRAAAAPFGETGEALPLAMHLAGEPLPDYAPLLDRQAAQLAALYAE